MWHLVRRIQAACPTYTHHTVKTSSADGALLGSPPGQYSIINPACVGRNWVLEDQTPCDQINPNAAWPIEHVGGEWGVGTLDCVGRTGCGTFGVSFTETRTYGYSISSSITADAEVIKSQITVGMNLTYSEGISYPMTVQSLNNVISGGWYSFLYRSRGGTAKHWNCDGSSQNVTWHDLFRVSPWYTVVARPYP